MNFFKLMYILSLLFPFLLTKCVWCKASVCYSGLVERKSLSNIDKIIFNQRGFLTSRNKYRTDAVNNRCFLSFYISGCSSKNSSVKEVKVMMNDILYSFSENFKIRIHSFYSIDDPDSILFTLQCSSKSNCNNNALIESTLKDISAWNDDSFDVLDFADSFSKADVVKIMKDVVFPRCVAKYGADLLGKISDDNQFFVLPPRSGGGERVKKSTARKLKSSKENAQTNETVASEEEGNASVKPTCESTYWCAISSGAVFTVLLLIIIFIFFYYRIANNNLKVELKFKDLDLQDEKKKTQELLVMQQRLTQLQQSFRPPPQQNFMRSVMMPPPLPGGSQSRLNMNQFPPLPSQSQANLATPILPPPPATPPKSAETVQTKNSAENPQP